MNRIILASSSPRRLHLLKQIGIVPALVIPADINEDPLRNEKADKLALRLAQQKSYAIASQYEKDFVIGADTIVYCKHRILPKPKDAEEAFEFMQLLSGRKHIVHSAVAVSHQGEVRSKLSSTKIKFKCLTQQEIARFVRTEDWKGKSGGYAIQGYASAFIESIDGMDSAVVGLPLADIYKLLESFGAFKNGMNINWQAPSSSN